MVVISNVELINRQALADALGLKTPKNLAHQLAALNTINMFTAVVQGYRTHAGLTDEMKLELEAMINENCPFELYRKEVKRRE